MIGVRWPVWYGATLHLEAAAGEASWVGDLGSVTRAWQDVRDIRVIANSGRVVVCVSNRTFCVCRCNIPFEG